MENPTSQQNPQNSDQPAPENQPTNPAPGTSGTGLPPNIAAGLACIFLLIGGIVFLLIEKKNAFVRFYAMQSILFGATIIVVDIALRVLRIIFGSMPVLNHLLWLISILSLLIGLLWLVIYIIQIVKAFSNQEWEIPYLGPIARKQLGKGKI